MVNNSLILISTRNISTFSRKLNSASHFKLNMLVAYYILLFHILKNYQELFKMNKSTFLIEIELIMLL